MARTLRNMRNNIHPQQISLFDALEDRGVIRERERERESKRLRHIYNDIISMENLLVAWQEFLCGKRNRKDVAEFSLHFLDNIVALHHDLAFESRTSDSGSPTSCRDHAYKHGGYQAFKINDPKPRDIHKASIRDRLVHHAIYRILYPQLDKKFIHDSYSCRLDKGTHRAIDRFREFGRIVSRNDSRTCWVLKGDIRKFFASIDHDILLRILERHIADMDVLWLLGEVVGSFHTENKSGIGLPLGNLTSQLLVNIYMNEFDQFVKRKLKVKCYIRYADDFVIMHEDKDCLESLVPILSDFLESNLKLTLHPDKLHVTTFASGVDFLGWVNFPHHRVLRTSTKRRMLKRVSKTSKPESVASYLGMLSHGNTYGLVNKIAIK